jgi:radical SAM superfamily enzyme YgiQ (UPF0313 family)
VRKSIYLINPRESTPGYFSLEVLKAGRIVDAVGLADLSTTTLAALIPRDWEIRICDERGTSVDFGTEAEVIGITGKVSQRDRIIQIADEFRSRGKLVIVGGPYASLNPDDIRPHADVLVRGEVEEIAGRVFADIASGDWQTDYEGTRPDLSLSPVPRWDLYHQPALSGQVQTSRGCPFECEFCDVIQYLGRKQRWKEPDQVIEELNVLYQLGCRNVFLADDNFTVVRRRARALLERLAEWNESRPGGRVEFMTQASIDLARDGDLLSKCAPAGLRNVFIGIETPNEESLAETQKRQNLRIDLAAEVRKITEAGMLVTSGMIAGFDHDDAGIFERQVDFASQLPVPIISFGLLVAPAATPLHARMKSEGRLVGHDRVGGASFLDTNIVPRLMTRAQLQSGGRWLLNKIYSPKVFGRRVKAFADICGLKAPGAKAVLFTPAARALAERLARCGSEEQELVRLIQMLIQRRPELRSQILYCLIYYCQIRYMLNVGGVWNPGLARENRPLAA